MRLVRAMLRLLPIMLVASLLLIDGGATNGQPLNRRARIWVGPVRKGNMTPPAAGNSPRMLGDRDRDKTDEGDSNTPPSEHRGPRDSIDARVPHNSSQAKQLEQAEQLITAGHWDQALERLEHVLAHSDHATMRMSDGRPGLVAWEANRLLARLPASALDTYRLRHEAQAGQLYRDAQQSGNWDQVMDVATRYFHTQTGKQAANAIGNFHFDRANSAWRRCGMCGSWTRPRFRRRTRSGN